MKKDEFSNIESEIRNCIETLDFSQAIKWGSMIYMHEKTKVIGVGQFKNFVSLWFFDGCYLTDPKKVLINANEGNTHALRQWRFTDWKSSYKKDIISYAAEALYNAKQGLVRKPQSKPIPETPEIMLAWFNENNIAKASFQNLTKTKKRDYIEYIIQAKQEKTKTSRMEKIKPLILAGVGINDKYKK